MCIRDSREPAPAGQDVYKRQDHYWVRANAVPLMRNGQPQGYMSVSYTHLDVYTRQPRACASRPRCV
ncbi:hypothetical protein [Burkholderia plantarii]|uniref:hypothetical protein n=1 Tax=Burkholderia plantarii TaxID=41899 RepID=UPI00114CFC59|nr:hypothetical protein [Burkholderia plantarii]